MFIVNYYYNLFLINYLDKIMLRYHGDWGLGIGDWGLGIGPNPQSPFFLKINKKIKNINLIKIN